MQPHQQRVVDEKKELDEKLDKLHEFILYSPIFQALPENEQARLVRQKFAMIDYSQILQERINAFPQSSD